MYRSKKLDESGQGKLPEPMHAPWTLFGCWFLENSNVAILTKKN